MDERAQGISFGTDGWRTRLPEFTTPRVQMVGQAVASHLEAEALSGPVAVGYDVRADSRDAADELARVVAANGRDVTIAARDCPTPTLAWTVADGPFVGGLMVTASHNPPAYNGIKFVTGDGAPALPEVTDALEAHLEPPAGAGSHGRIEEVDLIEPYARHLEKYVAADLDGLTVAYDGMHGSGREVVPEVLSAGGATVERLRCTSDAEFGETTPEPGPGTAADLVRRVTGDGSGKPTTSAGTQVTSTVDLGFVSDGDADRIGVVTPERGYLDPNVVLALLYDVLLEDGSGDAIRTVSTSSLLDRIATAAGQTVHETKVGFKWVAAAMTRHDTLAGGEESGGYGVSDHLHNKDGILVALVLSEAHAAVSLDARITALAETYGSVVQDRSSIACPESKKAGILATLESEPPERIAGAAVADISTVDGLKFRLETGEWVLVRPSGTEEKLRIYAEAESRDRLRTVLEWGEQRVISLLDR